MVGLWRGEGDALTFNDAPCNSTLEVIITNTMQVVTFDPPTTASCWRERESREEREDLQASFVNRQTADVLCEPRPAVSAEEKHPTTKENS